MKEAVQPLSEPLLFFIHIARALINGYYSYRTAVPSFNHVVFMLVRNLIYNDFRQTIIGHLKHLGAGCGAEPTGNTAASFDSSLHNYINLSFWDYYYLCIAFYSKTDRVYCYSIMEKKLRENQR